MYYREFGIPARIAKCTTVEELETQVKKYNGIKNCYTSVYVFADEKEDGKTNYESAMLNTIWFDFDDVKNVDRCLKDIRKFYRRFCKPRKIIPRVYLTGGKGFQMNIDFHSTVELPNSMKRESIKTYLKYLKKKYFLSTLDDICINNSVSCMRRIVNTQYISKIDNNPTGMWCTQFPIEAIMKMDCTELYALALEDNARIIPPEKSAKAQRHFVEFLCDQNDIRHTVSNGIDYLINEITKKGGSIMPTFFVSNEYIKPPRACVLELIERNIKRGHSSHEENNIIATELINAGYRDIDIHFIFESIYDEPAGEWGWYTNDPNKPGRQIIQIRQKALNRYSNDKLIELNICKGNKCSCI